MKRRFRYDRATDRMVEITVTDDAEDLPMVHGDIPAFRSPLDGTVVEGRKAYIEHMRKHGVVPYETGSEKVRPPKENPTARREMIWELVDRATRNRKIRD